MRQFSPSSKHIDGGMFKNQNRIGSKITLTFLMQAQLDIPCREIRNRLGKDAYCTGMTEESVYLWSDRTCRDHGMTGSKRQCHPRGLSNIREISVPEALVAEGKDKFRMVEILLHNLPCRGK